MDIESYFDQEFDDPTGIVPMPPQMAEFFAAAGTPVDECVFKVRGLTANDLAIIQERMETRKKIQEQLAKAASKNLISEAKADAARVFFEILDEKINPTFALQIHQVHAGCVSPKLPEQAIAKFGMKHAVEFKAVWLKIMELTGIGSSAKKKPSPSGEIQESEPT